MIDNYTNINYQYQEELATIIDKYYNKKPAFILKKEKILFPDNRIFFIKNGLIKQYLIDSYGKEKTFLILRRGDLFGEVSYIQKNQNYAYSEAIIDTQLYEIEEKDWKELSTSPIFLEKINQLLSMKVKIILHQLHDASFLNMKSRLYSSLLRLGIQKGLEIEDGFELRIQLSHDEISKIVNCSRENATRIINELESEGKIKRLKNRYYQVYYNY